MRHLFYACKHNDSSNKKNVKKTYSHGILSIVILKNICNTNEIYCIGITPNNFFLKMLQIHYIKLLIEYKFEMGHDIFIQIELFSYLTKYKEKKLKWI